MEHPRYNDHPVGWAYWTGDHWHLCADEPVAHRERQPVYLGVRFNVWRDRAEARGRELRVANDTAHERNRLLDAYHHVWCNGGCPGGVHHYTREPVTEDIVIAAELQAKRLRAWWTNANSRIDHSSPSAAKLIGKVIR